MESCPIPYTRLDTQDRIVAANKAFTDLFAPGRSGEDLSATTLRSMCFDQASMNVYDDVESRRKQNKMVEPYQLVLKSPSGPVTITIHSAAIPSQVRDVLPGTFGVLIPESQAAL
jgi:hypothetical protein